MFLLQGNMMKKNVNRYDRVIRAVIGIVLITMAVIGHMAWWGWLLCLIAAVQLLIALFGWCPMYKLAGIDTYHKQKQSDCKENC